MSVNGTPQPNQWTVAPSYPVSLVNWPSAIIISEQDLAADEIKYRLSLSFNKEISELASISMEVDSSDMSLAINDSPEDIQDISLVRLPSGNSLVRLVGNSKISVKLNLNDEQMRDLVSQWMNKKARAEDIERGQSEIGDQT